MQKNHANKRKRRKMTKRRRQQLQRRRRILGAAIILVLILAAMGLVLLLSGEETIPETVKVYPMEYTDLIREHAAEFGLDPAHVASVILAESSYNPQAVSSVNAQGLMQIMPDTGQWLAGKFKEDYIEGSLFDPETNIRYGCWYLGFLMDRYHGDIACTSVAYHSGQGNVDKWLKDPAYSLDGRTFHTIPGERATVYVNRILEYYEKYVELYNEEEIA